MGTRPAERAADTTPCEEIPARPHAEEVHITSAGKPEEGQASLRLRSDRLRSLGEMAAGMAHELNQPLSAIRGSAEHLLFEMDQGWETSEQSLKAKLEMIVQQSDRMAHIIEHVRRFARQAGTPETAQVQVNDVIESVMDLAGVQLRSRGFAISVNLACELPPVLINPFSLEEVILNLLNNARDAVDEKSQSDGESEYLVSVTTCLRDGQVAVVVEDNGTGIEEEDLERIFEPFYTTKDVDKGTGLGLSVSKALVTEAGGNLEIQSRPGEGTTAAVVLPAIVSGETGILGPDSAGHSGMSEAGRQILLVDDEEVIRQTIGSYLTLCGHRVDSYEDGTSAIEAIEKNNYDLALVDVRIPGMGGLELLDRARELCPKLAIIMITGHGDPEMESDMEKRGAAGFFHKPFSVRDLNTAIEKILDGEEVA